MMTSVMNILFQKSPVEVDPVSKKSPTRAHLLFFAFDLCGLATCLEMPTNVEIKAKLHTKEHFEETKQLAEKLSDQPLQVIVQEDTFFHSMNGRLKLRALSPEVGQLIFYDRTDASGPKQSFYDISETKEPAKLKTVLEKALGLVGVVAKKRYLYMVGQTRVHLDEVDIHSHIEERAEREREETANNTTTHIHAHQPQDFSLFSGEGIGLFHGAGGSDA